MAVIGSGVAGLSAARQLAGHVQLSVFESQNRAGGHIHAVPVVEQGRRFSLDTGFMVFNPINYPKLTQFFAEENIRSLPTSMSLAVRDKESGFEFTGSPFHKLFYQWRSFLRPRFTTFLLEIVRFNKWAYRALELRAAGGCDVHDGQMLMGRKATLNNPAGWMLDCTLGELRNASIFSEDFFRYYLFPMSGAIWSSKSASIFTFPMVTLVKFLYNHGMLGINTQYQWRVLENRSGDYFRKISRPFSDCIHKSEQVVSLKRVRLEAAGKEKKRVEVQTTKGRYWFDRVVVATHADESLAMLSTPTMIEKQLLSPFRYETSDVYLHSDASFMPKSQRLWSAWNVLCNSQGKEATGALKYQPMRNVPFSMSFHYYLNELQRIDAKKNYFVSLNPPWEVNPKEIFWQGKYSHPLLTVAAEKVKPELQKLNDQGDLFFCGSYFGSGFHEDGFASGLNAAEALKNSLQAEKDPMVKSADPKSGIVGSVV